MSDKYEAVIGLEVHAQLLTNSKAYSSDVNEYGSEPNSNVSEISLGFPGTLPRVNKKVLQYAIKLGLALNCSITHENRFDRKNYFYADLPKGYQITQDKTPICTNGSIDVTVDGKKKNIRLQRIHMEEDSGKSIHDQDPFNTLIDLNRAGVPLLEIVTEPDLRSSQEAYEYLTEIRKLVRYLEICDGNMEEGSLRCDANISIRPKGSPEFGRRVEVKNMNSIRNVQRAIEFEINRHIELTEKGEEIARETRSYDAVTNTTFSMRAKEMDNDYRYFPEPDLLPLIVTNDDIEHMRQEMPPLPSELFKKYTEEFGLSAYDASVIIDNKHVALYYEKILKHTANFKAAANWLTGDIKSHLNKNGLDITEFHVKPESIAEMISLIDDSRLSYSVAAQKLFPLLIKDPKQSAEHLAAQFNLMQESNEDSILAFVDQALEKYPEKVEEYRGGKKGLIGLFMGEVMKLSKGKADPKKANELLRTKLEQND